MPKIVRRHVWTGAMGSFWYTIFEPSGLYFSFFALHFMSKAQIGLLATAVSCAAACQVLSAAIERAHGRKYAWYVLAAVSRLLYFPFLLPLAWLSPGSITAVCFVVAALSQMTVPLWMSWVYDLVPRAQSGRFWAKRARGVAAIVLGVMLALGVVADRAGDRMVFVRSVFALAILVGFIDVLSHVRIPEPPPADPAGRTPLLSELLEPLRDRTARAWIFSLAFGSFAGYISAVFTVPFMLKDLKLDNFLVNTILITVLPTTANYLLLNTWGRVTDKVGPRPVLLIAYGWCAIAPLFFYFAGGRNVLPLMIAYWPLVGALALGVESSAKPKVNTLLSAGCRKSAFVAVATAVTMLAGGMGSLLGSAIVHLWGIRTCFAVSAAVRALAVIPFCFIALDRTRARSAEPG